MPDRIKEAFEATKDNGIFLDEEDFRNSLAKEPKAVFELFKSDKKYGDLFLDYDDFENSLGLKKKPSTSDASIFAPPISQGTGQSVKLPPTPTSSTASPSASKPQKSTTPSVSTGGGKKVSVPPITDKPIQLKQRPKTGVSDFVTPQEFEQQIKDKPTSANDKFIEDVNTNVLEIVKRDLDTFVYQKDMPTMYGTKKIPAGTPNVENIAKAVDLYAEKVKKETGQDISNTDKQYIINSTIESLKVRNQTQKAAMLTDLQFQQEKKVPLVAITGVKNEKGEILKQSMFQEGISKTLAEEQSRLNQIAKTPNKEISAEFAPELQSLNAEVKTSADILNKEMQDYFNSNFSQQQQQLYDQYNGLVQSGQMTEDMANEELKQKLQAIQEEIKLDTNDVFTPKLNQLKQEAESKVKEIQTRYNRKVEAQFELEKQKSAKRIEAQILEYENALPEGYMKEYQAAFQKNLDNEMNLEGLKKISEFSNLGNFEKMQTALMAGWGDVASTIGGALSYAGVNTGNLQNWVAQSGLYNELPFFNDDNVFDNLTNTDWWIANGVRSIPFTLATMPVGIFGGATAGVLARALGATKRAQMISSVVGGGLVGWEVERFLEQGAGFNDAINEGKSLEEAAEIAAAIGKYNYSTLPMNMLQMLPVFNKSFKFLGTAGIEAGAGAFEEINQGWAQAKAKAKSEGQDVSYLEYATSPQAIQEGAIGAAMSQGFTLLSLKNTPDIDKQINTLMTSIGMGGEAQALEVLKTMRNNGAIDDKQFQEATNLLNYTLTAISQTENINIDDNVKSALVNRFVAIEKAKELLTENENDLASQAAKELIAEKQEEIKSILKGSEPVYLIRVTGNDVPVVSTKEEVESLLKSEKMLPLFEIEVYNDNKTKASVEEVYAKIAPAEEKVGEQNESRISQEDTTAGDTAVEVAEPVIEEGERQDKEETPAVKEEEEVDNSTSALLKNLPSKKDEQNTGKIQLKAKNGTIQIRYIPFSIIEEANKNDNRGGQTAKQINDRGGYFESELDRLLPNWKSMLPTSDNKQEGETQEVTQPAKENLKGENVETQSQELSLKTDSDIEKRMSEIEGSKIGTPELAEFNSLEKEMEKRERNSVFNVTLEKVNDAVDALMKKEKEKPNGYGSFIEKRDARETKEVANRYLNAQKLTDDELKKDFSDSVRGNPTTWYADGLKMRESIKEANNRGIDINDMLAEVVKVYENNGYDTKTAKSVVSNMIKPILEGSQKINEKQISETKEVKPTETSELKDVESTAKALDKLHKLHKRIDSSENPLSKNERLIMDSYYNVLVEYQLRNAIELSEAYHKAKEDRSNPELVQAVEQLLTKKPQEDAVQKQTAGQVPVQPEAKVSEEVEGGKPKAEPKEAKEQTPEYIEKTEKNRKIIRTENIKNNFPVLYERVIKNFSNAAWDSADIRDALSYLISKKPTYKKGMEQLISAQIEAEKLLSELGEDTDFITKKQLLEKINSNQSYSKDQKDVFSNIVNRLKGDRFFDFTNKNIGSDNGYQFSNNLLKAKDADAFIHEVGHWGFYNLLSSEERTKYLEYVKDRFYGTKNKISDDLAIKRENKILDKILESNSEDNFSEYFAEQFRQYVVDGLAPKELESIFEKFKEYLTEIVKLFKDKGYNKDLKPFFDKIIREQALSVEEGVKDGEEVEGGKPETEPKKVAEEKQEEVAKFPENVLKIAKELNLSPQQVENTYKKYDDSKNIEDITLEDYNKARAEGNKIKVEKSKKAFEVLLKEGSVSPTAKKKAAEVKKEVGEKTIKDAEEIMNNIDSIRQQLLDAGVIKSINCKWGK